MQPERISTVLVASRIRKQLKAVFADTTFSVRKQRHSTIDVNWTNGPTADEVNNAIRHFVGYHTDEWGGLKAVQATEDGKRVQYVLQYLFCNRTYTPDFVRMVAKDVCERFGKDPDRLTYGPASVNGDDGQMIGDRPLMYIIREELYRTSEQVKKPTRNPNGVFAEQVKPGVWHITGNSFIHRRTIKADGGHWDGEQKAWVIEADHLPETVRQLVEGQGDVQAKTKTSPAGRFRKYADTMQKEIDEKRNPDRKTNTRRRMNIHMSMLQDADNLERIQSALRAIADGWDNDTLPKELQGITQKTQVVTLIENHSPPPAKSRPKAFKAMTRAGLGSDRLFSDARRELMSMIEKPPVDKKKQELDKLQREIVFQQIPGFFPTPENIIQQMLDLADIKAGEDVLEPSAGRGDIADAIREKHPDCNLDVAEWNYNLAKILRLKDHNVIETDCLALKPDDKRYDVIVMNPPFERKQDIQHIQAMFALLKPGGRLVSVVSEGPFFRQHQADKDFRDWLDTYGHDIDLPDGAFKQSDRSTGVKTRLITVTASVDHAVIATDPALKAAYENAQLIANLQDKRAEAVNDYGKGKLTQEELQAKHKELGERIEQHKKTTIAWTVKVGQEVRSRLSGTQGVVIAIDKTRTKYGAVLIDSGEYCG